MRHFAALVALTVGCTNTPVPAPAGPSVRVTLDGGLLQEVVFDGPRPVAVETLLPPGLALSDVRQIIATAHEDIHLGVRNPSIRHPGAQFALHLDPAQGPTFSITPPPVDGLSPETAAARAASAPRLGHVQTLALYVAPPPPPVDQTAGTPLQLVVNNAPPMQISAETLDDLARTADPRGRTEGWSLTDVLAAGGLTVPPTRLWVLPPQGAPIPLRLPSPTTTYILKYNKTGELRLQQWTPSSDQPRPDAVYKGISALKVETSGG